MVALPHTPIVKLLIAALVGLLQGIGVLLFVSEVFSQIVSFGASNDVRLLFSLIPVLIGPMFIALYLSSWVRGFISGLAGLGMAILLYPIWSLLPSNVWSLLPLHLDIGLEGVFFASFFVPVAATIEIGTKDVTTRREFVGLFIGIIVGLFSGFLSNLTFYQILGPSQPNVRLFISSVQLPPLVWSSVIFFPLLVSKQIGRHGFLMYFLLIIIAFGIPFMMVSFP